MVSFLGKRRLLLPEDLWSQLDDPGRQAIVYHELAHLRRRDDWVRSAALRLLRIRVRDRGNGIPAEDFVPKGLLDAYPDSWAKASFKYITTKKGWAQSRPPQFFTDLTYQVQMDQTNYAWEFEQWATDLHAYAAPFQHGVYRLSNGAYFSNVPQSTTLFGLMYTAIRAKDLKPSITGTINGGGPDFELRTFNSNVYVRKGP